MACQRAFHQISEVNSPGAAWKHRDSYTAEHGKRISSNEIDRAVRETRTCPFSFDKTAQRNSCAPCFSLGKRNREALASKNIISHREEERREREESEEKGRKCDKRSRSFLCHRLYTGNEREREKEDQADLHELATAERNGTEAFSLRDARVKVRIDL